MKYLAQINREIGCLSFASLKDCRYLSAFEYDNMFCDLKHVLHLCSVSLTPLLMLVLH